jgi:hypothetical protein
VTYEVITHDLRPGLEVEWLVTTSGGFPVSDARLTPSPDGLKVQIDFPPKFFRDQYPVNYERVVRAIVRDQDVAFVGPQSAQLTIHIFTDPEPDTRPGR